MSNSNGSSELQGEVDERRRRKFEQAWHAGSPITIDDCLPAPQNESYLGTLEELVCLELEQRCRQADARDADEPRAVPLVEDYLERFPDLGDDAILMRLVREEFLVRHRFGDRPEAEAYATRFPNLVAARFGNGIGIGEWLASDPELARIHVERAQAAVRVDAHGYLGRYELVEEIGRGSFSRVWRAHDPHLDRLVAIKVPRAELVGDEAMLARFHHEARTAAQLRHPGIVSVHEVGDEDGVPFLVCDLVEGPSLETLLTHERPSQRQATDWVARIADALDYAHQFGVVHRDVKPANVLTQNDAPVVTDFGLAFQYEAQTHLTRAGDVLGTPAYMAPEQASGHGEVDARTDVYSLGVVLYRMLTGRLPFRGGYRAVLNAVQTMEPPAPRELHADVPVELQTICLTAMAKEPERRYASASEFAADLRRFLANEPIHASPPSWFERTRLWCRRNPNVAMTLIMSTAIIAAVVAFGARAVLRERDRFRSERDAAQTNLYNALVAEAHAQFRGRGTGWWWKAMEDVQLAAALETDARDERELRALAVQLMGSNTPCLRVVGDFEETAVVYSVAIDATGSLLAVGTDSGVVGLRRLSDAGQLAHKTPGNGAVHGLAFHPTEPMFASTSQDGSLRIWRWLAEEEELMLVHWRNLGNGALERIDWSPNGEMLAVACANGAVAIVDAETPDDPVRLLHGHERGVIDVAFAPDSSLVASASLDATARVWNTKTGAHVETFMLDDYLSAVEFSMRNFVVVSAPKTYGFRRFHLGNPAWTRVRGLVHSAHVTDLAQLGRKIVTASRDGSIKIWSRSLEEIAIAEGGPSPIETIAVSPRGDRIVAAHADNTVQIWEVREPSQRVYEGDNPSAFRGDRTLVTASRRYRFDPNLEHKPTPREPPSVSCVAPLSAGSGWVAGTRQGQILHVNADGSVVRRWLAHNGPITALAIAPVRDTVATTGGDGRVVVWQLDGTNAEGLPPAQYELELGPVSKLSWSANGQKLLASSSDGRAAVLIHPGTAQVQELDLPKGVAIFTGDTITIGTTTGAVATADSDGRVVQPGTHAHAKPIVDLHWEPTTSRLLSVDASGAVLVWDAPNAAYKLAAGGFIPSWVAIDPKGRYALAGRRSIMRVFDLEKGAPLNRLRQRGVCCGTFGPDGELAFGTTNGALLRAPVASLTIKQRTGAGGTPAAVSNASGIADIETLVPGGHTTQVWGLAHAPSGELTATIANDGTVSVWDARDGDRLLWSAAAHEDAGCAVAFDATSRRLATTSYEVAIWDAETGERLMTLPRQTATVTSAAFLPDDRLLATCSEDGWVRVWDLERAHLATELAQVPLGTHQLALDPARELLALACHDGSVRVWETAILAKPPVVLQPLSGTSPIWTVAFDPRGERLVAGDEAGTLTMWEVGSWREELRLPTDTRLLRSSSFSGDGELLAAGTLYGSGIVWDLPAVERKLEELGLGGRQGSQASGR
ncbi:MAG: protein kinase [bacterium]|nr:protein kinase [bacterium]